MEEKNLLDKPVQKKKEEFITPSYSGVWISTDLYLEVGLVRDGTFVRLRNKQRDLVAQFNFEDFNRRVKALRSSAKKLSQM